MAGDCEKWLQRGCVEKSGTQSELISGWFTDPAQIIILHDANNDMPEDILG